MAEEKKDVADKQQKKQHHNKDKEWGKPFPPEQSGNPAGRPKNDKMVKEPEEIEQSIEEKEGVTLRDRFAMSALESAISTPALYRDTNERAVIAARISYIFADAMLKAREESC